MPDLPSIPRATGTRVCNVSQGQQRALIPPPKACASVVPRTLLIEGITSNYYNINPANYGCGFSSDGRIIGSNLTVPYPGEVNHHHNQPFKRLVEWYTPNTVGLNDKGAWDLIRRKNKERVGGRVDGCGTCEVKSGRVEGGNGGGVEEELDSQQILAAAPPHITEGWQDGAPTGNKVVGEGEEGDDKPENPESACCAVRHPIYIVKDDPEYKAWVDGKVEAQRDRDKAQAELRKVPWEMKLFPGHQAPAVMQTTNEVYGHYTDMLPRLPLKYPEVEVTYKPAPLRIRYRRSNFSDHPPIPDHGFAVPRSELESENGKPLRTLIGAPYSADEGGMGEARKYEDLVKYGMRDDGPKSRWKIDVKPNAGDARTEVGGEGVLPPAPGMQPPNPWHFKRSQVMLGRVVGERKRGFTFPVYTPTGLELNRPVRRNINMLEQTTFTQEAAVSKEVPKKAIEDIYDPKDSQAHEMILGPHKQKCTPHQKDFSGYDRSHPCHRDYFNKEYHRVPVSWQAERTCDPAGIPLACDDPRVKGQQAR